MSVNLNDLPNEMLVEIFSHLDSKSLYEAGQVCIRWESIVQVVHNKAFRKISKIAMFRKSTESKFKALGWIKKDHSFKQCRCLDIKMKIQCYENLELFSADLAVSSSIYISYGLCRLSSLEQIEAAARLSSAGIWCSSLNWISIENVDLSSSVQNLQDLIEVANEYFQLAYVQCNDFQAYKL